MDQIHERNAESKRPKISLHFEFSYEAVLVELITKNAYNTKSWKLNARTRVQCTKME